MLINIHINNIFRKNRYKNPVGENVIVNSLTFSKTPDTLPAPAAVRTIKDFDIHQLFRWVQLTAPENRKIPNVGIFILLSMVALQKHKYALHVSGV